METLASPPQAKNFFQNMSLGTLHIVAELLAIVGISYYFFNKNKILTKNIQEITQRLEEQDEILSRHEEILNKLVMRKANGNNNNNNNVKVGLPKPLAPQKAVPQKVEQHMNSKDSIDSLLTTVPVPPPLESSITELDDEIQQELAELDKEE